VLEPGESFGNFRVVKCLSAGLVANYYHMQHIRDFRDVTVGILHDKAGRDPQLLRRLLTLQKTLRNFEHEGIPKISDCTRIEEQLCIVLEPVGGQSLSQYFQAHATPGQSGIGLEASTRILAQLLGLLGYAHSQGIDHRDLDTDMILVQEDGSLRVLGFGIKAALGTQVFDSIVSASVSPLVSNNLPHRLNSFDVMSPEYKQGITEDFRVDIFCAGTIGYWLLTGRKANRNQLELPSTLLEELSAQWDVFFKVCSNGARSSVINPAGSPCMRSKTAMPNTTPSGRDLFNARSTASRCPAISWSGVNLPPGSIGSP